MFGKARASDDVAHAFISFMHRNFPSQEENRYTTQDWKDAAAVLGVHVDGLSKEKIVARVREFAGYMDVLRRLKE